MMAITVAALQKDTKIIQDKVSLVNEASSNLGLPGKLRKAVRNFVRESESSLIQQK